MTSVKGFVPRTERHAALLMGFLLREVRDVFAAEDWKGLRQSHFRPRGGVGWKPPGRIPAETPRCGQRPRRRRIPDPCRFRVISAVPAEGISITELGDRVGMTKQGCGQFVTQLVQSGQLRVEHSRAGR